jgi:hypothetical protein
MFQTQRERFREKFGRDPGPDDPVIFDPDADEPRPLDVDKAMAEMLAGLTENPSPYVRSVLETMAEVGYLITEENRHTFSAEEIAAWERALTRHYEANGVTEESFADDAPDDEAGTWGDVIEMAADALELATGMVVTKRDLRVADEFEARIRQGTESDADDEEATVAEIVVTVFLGWMIGAREAGTDANAALAWLHEAFGEEETMRFLPLFSLLTPQTFVERGLDWTLNDLADQVGDQLIRGAVALSAAVAVTAGGGDAHWLRQFDAH